MKAGSIRGKTPEGDEWISKPGDALYSSSMFCASEYWSEYLLDWVPIEHDIQLPQFLTMNEKFAHLNSDSARFKWGVTLDGVPLQKWETADSQRGYADVWMRVEIPTFRIHGFVVTISIRHRLFGRVEFVRLT